MSQSTCSRVALSTATKRRLWSESGGFCQNPSCARRLFDEDSDVDFAEMAHVISAAAGGPRGVPVSEVAEEVRAEPENIVVLCANCHRIVDKAPESYPAEVMRGWKRRHQALLEQALGTPRYWDRGELAQYVGPRLAANRLIHDRYGPKPDVLSEATAEQWRRHLLATIIPNNAALARVLEANRHLLTTEEGETADEFALHVRELEFRHLLDDWTAGSSRFPESMSTMLQLAP